LSSNRHFAAGANAGLRWALARGADYVWLLNNDVTVAPDALAEMVRVAQADARIGVVGARIVHTDRRARVIVGAMCDLASGAIHEPLSPAEPDSRCLTVDYVWGCAMLLRSTMLDQVGLLDERYVAYFEDTDLCLRARRSGWRTATALRATVCHVGSKAANRRFVQQMWLRGRNWLWCFWRHAHRTERPRLLLSMLGHRLPHLAWSSLVTVGASAVRPGATTIRLWSPGEG
jgi:GT2 family glycosyltransferase